MLLSQLWQLTWVLNDVLLINGRVPCFNFCSCSHKHHFFVNIGVSQHVFGNEETAIAVKLYSDYARQKVALEFAVLFVEFVQPWNFREDFFELHYWVNDEALLKTSANNQFAAVIGQLRLIREGRTNLPLASSLHSYSLVKKVIDCSGCLFLLSKLM